MREKQPIVALWSLLWQWMNSTNKTMNDISNRKRHDQTTLMFYEAVNRLKLAQLSMVFSDGIVRWISNASIIERSYLDFALALILKSWSANVCPVQCACCRIALNEGAVSSTFVLGETETEILFYLHINLAGKTLW